MPCNQNGGESDTTTARYRVATTRIKIEHVLAGVKHCRIVREVLRNTKDGSSDLVILFACGLHNLHVSFRQPVSLSSPPIAYLG